MTLSIVSQFIFTLLGLGVLVWVTTDLATVPAASRSGC